MNSYNDFTDINQDWADKTFTDRLDLSGDSINVLSCFDGLSGGQIALDKAGIKVNQYFASEIDKYAIAVAKYNYPNTIHLGDVKKIDAAALPRIDLMLAGSPCTDLSFAGLGKGLVEGEQSSLFFDWWRLVQQLKPKYIFLENVRMKKEYKTMISELLGFDPVAINSALVSAQNRHRLYWLGVRDGDTYKAVSIEQPKDRGITLPDILEQGLDDTWTLSNQAQDRARNNPRSRAFTPDQEKSGALLSNQYKQSTDGLYALYQQPRGWNKGGYKAKDGKTPSLTTSSWEHNNHLVSQIRDKSKAVRVGGRGSYDRHEWDSVDELHWRKLTPKECSRLQTVPDNYCIMGNFDGVVKPVSKSQQYKMLGNGWTIDVIAHILEGIK